MKVAKVLRDREIGWHTDRHTHIQSKHEQLLLLPYGCVNQDTKISGAVYI